MNKEEIWLDIDKVKPYEGQPIFYLDTRTIDNYRTTYKRGLILPCTDDTDRGIYLRDNLVEWYCDAAPEEFKLWYPIPYIKLEGE